ncbi:DUF1206 domain-containing protein [Altericroceibacterium spongiae]|uniref:DUF1206 domain-containing protein n=1 Tax=Altericroceibacterium spongiae TaxID=2320269 RepID=A0A420ERS7_9SPHN|nr:DUF1206 domain-containing protein [Altericroceibacterium spongiae]RKF23416.1 DUF1206 domain-containing protein [Altericroceibacterium spongiae]
MVDKSEKFRWLIRLGFASRGVVYALIGYLALSGPGQNDGPSGSFSYLQDMPAGTPLLYVAALGLLGYGLYRLCSPVFDIENYGHDKTGIAHRVGHAGSAFAHFVLAYTALQFAMGSHQSGSGSTAEQAADTVLSVSFGGFVLGLLGLAFLLAGLAQAKKGLTASFMQRISAQAPAFVEWLGRAGFFARTVVFVIIGWSLIQSAWFSSSERVKTLGEAITSLADSGALYNLVAIGLLLFGIFSIFMARYRIVPDLDSSGLKPAFRG